MWGELNIELKCQSKLLCGMYDFTAKLSVARSVKFIIGAVDFLQTMNENKST